MNLEANEKPLQLRSILDLPGPIGLCDHHEKSFEESGLSREYELDMS